MVGPLQPGDWGPLLFTLGIVALLIVGLLGLKNDHEAPSCHADWISPSQRARPRTSATSHRNAVHTTETEPPAAETTGHRR